MYSKLEPPFETALKEYEMFPYPEVNLGLFNNTTPRYDEAATNHS
ncbi:hypothetical protein [Flavobacterium sp.]